MFIRLSLARSQWRIPLRDNFIGNRYLRRLSRGLPLVASIILPLIGAASSAQSLRNPVSPAPTKTALAEITTVTFAHEQVLGTSLEIRLAMRDGKQGTTIEQAILAEIDRGSAIFSSYNARSEFSRFLASDGESVSLSRELHDVLHACDQWQVATHGGFHPGVEVYSQIWQDAMEHNRLPTSNELATAREQLREPLWTLDAQTTKARRHGHAPATLNAIAKGAIIDMACAVAAKHPAVVGGSINIGGDLRVFGDWTEDIPIEIPIRKEERVSPSRTATSGTAATSTMSKQRVTVRRLRHQAMASSGGGYRGFEIGGKHYSHLIDPHTGLPVESYQSVTVIADTAADADALATALSIMPLAAGLQQIENVPHAACWIVDAAGVAHASTRWKMHDASPAIDSHFVDTTSREPGPWQVDVSFAIHASGGQRYRRPYIAVWVEDSDGFPIRTLALWVQTSGPGPRWIPDLKRWYRSDRVRKLAEDTDLVEMVSEPTKKPGEYHVSWDGRDAAGKDVLAGEYTLMIEAAREHGTYQLARQKITLGAAPQEWKLANNDEIHDIVIKYQGPRPQ